MKTLNKYFIALFTLSTVFLSCDNGIDKITAVSPGDDSGAPIVTVVRPANGFEIQVPEAITSVNIEFKVQDDIEVSLIKVKFNGEEIASFNDFLDYRIVNRAFTFDNVPTGSHVLTVEATDIAGNVTISTTNFSKAPPYTPLFRGETFYMNFDGSYSDLVTNKDATEVGGPGFTSDARVGINAYRGAADSYLTFPTAGLLGNEFSASFWYKMNDVPNRAGIFTIGRVPEDVTPANNNHRNFGIRFFRESRAGRQSFRLNVGNGTTAVTALPPATADLPTGTDWVHFAFTITPTKAIIYLNGEVIIDRDITGLDWTGCDIMSIMSGAPRYTWFNHFSDLSFMDDLRLFNTVLTPSEILNLVAKSDRIFSVPFNGSFNETITRSSPTIIGNPTFTTDAKAGINAYKGATDAYLTFATTGLLNQEFTATMWYKVNAIPDRAGILVMGPPDTANPTSPNNRSSGFRFFREGSPTNQTFKLNVGNGTADSWFDGGAAASINPATNSDWVHLAFSISNTESVVYINGQVVSRGPFSGVNWDGCDVLSIMSGAPRFTGFNHFSDLSVMDELAIYKRALSQAEIMAVMTAN